MYHFNMNFSEWLTAELDTRGWSRSEAARRGKISPSMFDKVINGYSKPGTRFLDGLAQAFGISPVILYRKAGLLPEGGEQASFEDWQHLLAQLTNDEQEEMRAIIEMKIDRRQKAEQSARSKNFKPKKAG
jgi:transcriptional regulator with XRE-family HTH domain